MKPNLTFMFSRTISALENTSKRLEEASEQRTAGVTRGRFTGVLSLLTYLKVSDEDEEEEEEHPVLVTRPDDSDGMDTCK
ncbi:wsv382 [White spot syndrome virus]|uniref:Wsv382 n=3 Tax=White spot syndrome virus TaxID=342409 RepID=Q8VAL9_WSSVS|nr:wsv382 [Shrimp white spot syndrome virus]AFX59759.1 wsv382 [White spot syndrome virus]AAL33384.1 wsv382 [Shrimp white spot syndrome virus]AAL89309.1 WSSV441 [Shrimp white spot syndrome virus]AWQ60507.1 wsv382 [Shrimp white spot syndrome virus]AWQ60952.1 wsv382 [Shrimp white spot syndrome virus]